MGKRIQTMCLVSRIPGLPVPPLPKPAGTPTWTPTVMAAQVAQILTVGTAVTRYVLLQPVAMLRGGAAATAYATNSMIEKII